jgi:hypothetical protein
LDPQTGAVRTRNPTRLPSWLQDASKEVAPGVIKKFAEDDRWKTRFTWERKYAARRPSCRPNLAVLLDSKHAR